MLPWDSVTLAAPPPISAPLRALKFVTVLPDPPVIWTLRTLVLVLAEKLSTVTLLALMVNCGNLTFAFDSPMKLRDLLPAGIVWAP